MVQIVKSKLTFSDLDSKTDKEEERRQNMKYDSSTGKMYEELGCSNNNGAGSAMDTSAAPSTTTTSAAAAGMSQSQQMHSDYYQNYQHAYPYSSQVKWGQDENQLTF